MGRLDARQIIEQIMADPRFARSEPAHGSCFTSRVYEDEPILMTGSQMAGYVPPVYRAARDISRSFEANRRGRAWLFREQGLVLADAEDDCPYHGRLSDCYYPTYQGLSDRQLRGYVTWRTGVRRGTVEVAPLPFAFIYIYELLNGIGVASPDEGFERLLGFWQAYREFDATPSRYVKGWLYDYVAYHGLDAGLLGRDDELAADLAADRALVRVLGGADADEAERFEAYAALSSYRVTGSRLYRAHPDDLRHVALAVLDRLAVYYHKNRAYELNERLFGAPVVLPYQPFASAVFYEPHRHADAVYEFSPIRRLTCRRGVWTYERYPNGHGSSTKLGAVLRAVDARLRVRLAFPNLLKEQDVPKYLAQIIDREIDSWLAWKQAHAPRHIEIDRSKLGGIRRSAAATCEELLVDEERADAPASDVGERADAAPEKASLPADALGKAVLLANAPGGASPVTGGVFGNAAGADAEARAGAPVVAVPAEGNALPASATLSPVPCAAPVLSSARPAAPPPCGLTALEAGFLGRLLAGEPYADLVAGAPVTLDMLVDGINEKLFDLIGDTALEFDGAEPAVIEDYRDDVKGAVQP